MQKMRESESISAAQWWLERMRPEQWVKNTNNHALAAANAKVVEKPRPPTPKEARKLFDDVMRAGGPVAEVPEERFTKVEAEKENTEWSKSRKKKNKEFLEQSAKIDAEAEASISGATN